MTADTPTPITYIMVYDDDLMVTLDADTLEEAMREFSRRYIEASNDALNRKNGTDYVTQTVRVSGDNTGLYELPYSLDRTSDRSWTFRTQRQGHAPRMEAPHGDARGTAVPAGFEQAA